MLSSDVAGFAAAAEATLLVAMAPTALNATAAAHKPQHAAAVSVGATFATWKEAVAAVRALASAMGRRALAEKPAAPPPADAGASKSAAVARRVVCQNHRNSHCGWAVLLEENLAAAGDQCTILALHLAHSKECLETHHFSARRKEPAVGKGEGSAAAHVAPPSESSALGLGSASGSLLVDDPAKYRLTREMCWSTGKEATKAISDYALVVQRKRSKLCKKNNGGSNKKYVCSDAACLWFVQLVRGWKSKTWKISAMNLRHSDACAGAPKPTARQLAEMRFFRQAVVAHSRASGKLLTESFLLHADAGLAIPRGMAYRAQRLVVATSTDDLTESYKYLPSLLSAFAAKNPGSTVALEKDDAGRFVRAFVMPNAASLALLCMQPVFGVQLLEYDTVSYGGVLALLVGRDGNLQSQVVAFALVPSGDAEHMKWFLALCRAGGARFDGLPVFCGHAQPGLLRALAHEAPDATVLFCVRSLLEVLGRDKTVPALGALEALVWEAQAHESEDGFCKALAQLEALNAPAAAFLRAVPAKHWAVHANRALRLYEWASTNAAEATAGADVHGSDEAPFDLLYSFLAFVMDQVCKKSQVAAKLFAEGPLLTPGADALYRREFHEAAAFTVRLCDEHVAFTWRTGARPKVTHRVNLALRSCTCLSMGQRGIPCRHFVAVALHFANEAVLMDAFAPFYKAAMYVDVHRSLRIEIPAAEDLHKDPTMLPAASLRTAKYTKRVRSSSSSSGTAAAAAAAGVLTEEDEGEAAAGDDERAGGALQAAKAPRLEFDAEVVTGLTELV
ncbi:hypothetical protein PybrP1_011574 [[Pythium] brassicae (nom. inval.)]|nr:hypothetical protein PybrP1_011574 [[Pythium] brassicae (nom. inval.)]